MLSNKIRRPKAKQPEYYIVKWNDLVPGYLTVKRKGTEHRPVRTYH